jgi:tight adherence protein B
MTELVDADAALILAMLLAGLSAAGFVAAAFFPLLAGPRLAGRRSAIFEALLKRRGDGAATATRTVRRAQEAALRSVNQQSRARRGLSSLAARLAAAGLDWSAHHYLALCATTGLIAFRLAALAGFSAPMALAAALLAAWVLPGKYLDHRAAQRRRAFLTAFGTAVDMVVRGAKSGLSMMDCLAMVASDAPQPVAREFEAVVAQLRAGVPLPAAMEKLSAAMPAPEVRFFVMIMSAQNQTGGNLSEALTNLSGVLRDREKIAAKIRVASAEGRASAMIIGALPFVVIGAAAAFSPDYIALLWTDEAGRRVAAFCAAWLAAGIAVLIRMARIEV